MKNKEYNCYLKKSVGLCTRGDLKEFGKLTLTVSLVYLQGAWGWFCSPLMKSSNLSQKMIASLEDLYLPWPLVAWSVHTRSSMQNDREGGICILVKSIFWLSPSQSWPFSIFDEIHPAGDHPVRIERAIAIAEAVRSSNQLPSSLDSTRRGQPR